MWRALLTSLVLAGCGSPQALQHRPLFVLLGGGGSCKADNSPFTMPLYGPFERLTHDIEQQFGREAPYVLSCLDGNSNLFFATQPGRIETGDRWALLRRIGETSQQVDATDVLAVGHSYGGWLALRSLLDMPASALTVSLVTIDPISMQECSPSKPLGCQQFPSDIPRQDRERVAGLTTLWVNFFQTRTWYLHSGSVPEADRNPQVDTDHATIDTHADVWREIRESAFAYY